jgi:hypothetical protein
MLGLGSSFLMERLDQVAQRDDPDQLFAASDGHLPDPLAGHHFHDVANIILSGARDRIVSHYSADQALVELLAIVEVAVEHVALGEDPDELSSRVYDRHRANAVHHEQRDGMLDRGFRLNGNHLPAPYLEYMTDSHRTPPRKKVFDTVILRYYKQLARHLSATRLEPHMKHWVLNGLLLLVVLSGAIMAWRSGRERSRLTERFARLVRATGDLTVADPSLVYLRAVETGEPLHYAWRVYFPPNYNQIMSSRNGMTSSGSSSSASEFLSRVRLRPDDRGAMQVYTHFANGSSISSIDGPQLTELLRGRWDKVRVEMIGSPEVASLKPNQHAVLLRLTLPDDLIDEAKKKFSPDDQKRCVPVLFELELGPKP